MLRFGGAVRGSGVDCGRGWFEMHIGAINTFLFLLILIYIFFFFFFFFFFVVTDVLTIL